MRRRPEEPNHDHERWLVSYADFITLLFAFFVVMYAISTLNDGKYRVLSEALIVAFRNEHGAAPQIGMGPPRPIALPVARAPAKPEPGPRVVQEQKLRGLAARIVEAMNPLAATGNVHFRETARGLAVEINASVLFHPAEAVLQPDAIAALQAFAVEMKSVPNAIEVEGHTDKLPISTALYPSNWELASARASAVVRLFVATGLPPDRLSAVSYADNRPIEVGDSPENLARNRRVTLLVLSDDGAPGAAAPESSPR